jgi:integrase
MDRVRAERRLKAKDIGKLGPGIHEDGGGLRLIVEPTGSRRWAMRYTIAGRRRSKGLGSFPLVSLEDAREEADALRRAARKGQDIAPTKSVTFRQAFDTVFELRRRKLSNAKHVWQWQASMERYAFPRLGDRPVSRITHSDVLGVLEPIWHEKAETARRLLQRMELTFRSAILRGHRKEASPCIGVAEELGAGHREVEHHRALPYSEVADFIETLLTCNSEKVTRLGFEFLILTATRSGETRGAMWSEIDGAWWVIPRERMMKGRREHAVPLSRRCLAILEEAKGLPGESPLVFPSRTGRPLSDMTFVKVLRDLGLADRAVPHGFRSSFRDWCSETGEREVVAESALAHRVKDRTEAAYRRTDFRDERVGLMQRWADHCERR